MLLAAILLLGLFALTVSLGQWQTRRAEEKTAMAAQRERALASPVNAIGAVPQSELDLNGLRVSATGEFEPERSVLLDNRTHHGRAGFYVLTPLRLEDGRGRVVVLRGWVERDPRGPTVVPEIRTPKGRVQVEGLGEARLAQAMLLGSEKIPGVGDRIWQSFDLERFRVWSGVPIQPLILRQTSESNDGLVREWPIAASGIDKHRGYALQWYFMAATIAVLAVMLTVRQYRSNSGK